MHSESSNFCNLILAISINSQHACIAYWKSQFLQFNSCNFLLNLRRKISCSRRDSSPHTWSSDYLYQRLRPLGHPSLFKYKCKSGVYEVTMTFCNIVFGLPTWTICNFELIDLRVNYIPHWKALSSVRGQSKTMSLLAWTYKRLSKKWP